jgi:hypothetical protein
LKSTQEQELLLYKRQRPQRLAAFDFRQMTDKYALPGLQIEQRQQWSSITTVLPKAEYTLVSCRAIGEYTTAMNLSEPLAMSAPALSIQKSSLPGPLWQRQVSLHWVLPKFQKSTLSHQGLAQPTPMSAFQQHT